MILKKYEADTVRECLEQVKQDLGDDAVIVRTEQIGGQFVVSAALENENTTNQESYQEEASEPNWSQQGGVESQSDGSNVGFSAAEALVNKAGLSEQIKLDPNAKPESKGVLALKDLKARSLKPKKISNPYFEDQPDSKREPKPESVENPSRYNELKRPRINDISERKQNTAMGETISSEIREMRKELQSLRTEMKREKMGSITSVPSAFKESYVTLRDYGVSDKVIKDAIADTVLNLEPGERNPSDIYNGMLNSLLDSTPIAPLPQVKKGRAVTVAFVGPTGVGKTTTLAKFAANCILDRKLKIGILSTDAYRMGAMEQMQHFARAAEIEFEAVYQLEDLDSILEKWRQKDLILIDTAGRSRKHQAHLDELKVLMESVMPDEVHLVLAANTREKDLKKDCERFACLGANRLIVTKLDESSEPGCLFNLPIEEGYALSMLTYGQNIPEDWSAANFEKLRDFFIPNENED